MTNFFQKYNIDCYKGLGMIDYDRAKNDPEYAHKVLLSYLILGKRRENE